MEYTRLRHYELTRRVQVEISKTNEQNSIIFDQKSIYSKKKQKFFSIFGGSAKVYFDTHFYTFSKKRIVSKKDTPKKHISCRNKNSGNIGKKWYLVEGRKKGPYPFPPKNKFLTEILLKDFYDINKILNNRCTYCKSFSNQIHVESCWLRDATEELFSVKT